MLLRPGPYICGEWEGGGLPSWLLADPDLELRSTDPAYLQAVEGYLDALMPIVLPRLGTHGGPVIAVQVENEYGAYGSDTAYMERLYEALTSRGIDVPLFTSDQPGDLADGALPGVLATANFGGKVTASLAALRAQQPTGPLMCAEFWNGWFDYWGGIHSLRSAEDAGSALEELLEAGASVNFYMFHGGTNFGFTNGANDKGTYRATVTSYDYDSPLDEAGDPTEKYRRFRSIIGKYEAVPDEEVPEPGEKLAPLSVDLTGRAPLFASASLEALGTAQTSESPVTMERLGQDFGFVLYEAQLPAAGPVALAFDQIGDRAQVFVDGQPVAVLERERHEHVVSFTVPRAGARLRVLVENQGRVNYGRKLADRKGLIGAVHLDGAPLTGWSSRPLTLDDLSGVTLRGRGRPGGRPVLPPGRVPPGPHRGHLSAPGRLDEGRGLGERLQPGPLLVARTAGLAVRPGAGAAGGGERAGGAGAARDSDAGGRAAAGAGVGADGAVGVEDLQDRRGDEPAGLLFEGTAAPPQFSVGRENMALRSPHDRSRPTGICGVGSPRSA